VAVVKVTAFSFLHCADIHLGSPMRGLGRMPRALRDRLRDAPTTAFGRLVTAAIDHEVDAFIIAGDLFDGTDRNLRAQVQLRDQLRRLDRAGIATLIAAGNHDPIGSLSSTVSLPPSVHGIQNVAQRTGDDGKRQTLDVKKGQKVLIGKYSGTEVKIEGEDYVILREDDILGIVG